MTVAERHVVFGAGQVGPHLAARLSAAGHQVSIVSRSGRTKVDGVRSLVGDATDAAFCDDALRGARVAYHCMNPRYSTAAWQTQLPLLQRNLVEACSRHGARLVMLDNLYGLGRTNGRAMNEDTPLNPCSKKGEVRAQLALELIAAHQRGDVRAVLGRASDFFGPGGVQSMFEGRFWRRVLARKSAQVIIDPDTPHTYHFIPDVAAGLAVLGTAGDEDCGRAWMLPCGPAESTRALIGRIAAAVGHEVPVSEMPEWLFGALKLVVPIFREMGEMRYQWREPFVVDARRFRERFGTTPTPAPDAVRQTVAWARRTFADGAH